MAACFFTDPDRPFLTGWLDLAFDIVLEPFAFVGCLPVVTALKGLVDFALVCLAFDVAGLTSEDCLTEDFDLVLEPLFDLGDLVALGGEFFEDFLMVGGLLRSVRGFRVLRNLGACCCLPRILRFSGRVRLRSVPLPPTLPDGGKDCLSIQQQSCSTPSKFDTSSNNLIGGTIEGRVTQPPESGTLPPSLWLNWPLTLYG